MAVSLAQSPAEGLRLLEPLADALRDYAPYFLALADMRRRSGDSGQALEAYRTALDLTRNRVERESILARIGETGAA